MSITRPKTRPANPNFSSGPCAKRPGWTVEALSDALVGRSHRSKPGKAKLRAVIDETRALLGIPDDYRVGIVPASDTGAVEMAMWSLLGVRPVDMVGWESVGKGWITDATKQLALADCRTITADYGELPDLHSVRAEADVVFTWNGTTAGVRVPNLDWLREDREGLAICDATSAVFAMDVPFDKLDVVTWSWQKVLGGEAAHGMLVLSPRAATRLETFAPERPLPKIFRMMKGGAINEGIWQGATINTPSMICVEDALDALRWARSVGGLPGMIRRSEANLAAISAWVERTPWARFQAKDPATRSCTSICLVFAADPVASLDAAAQTAFMKRVVALLDEEGVGYDLAAYSDAPPGLRIWGGATVETSDIEALLPWLDWAYATAVAEL
jgi:phosphoserine aminotransferase